MTDHVTLRYSFKPQNARNGRPRKQEPPMEVEEGNVPRISKLMALALHFEQAIENGFAENYADLASLGGVTRGRMSQIMSLLNLAPDIIEEVLFLPRITKGWDPINTAKLVKLSLTSDWVEQRENFKYKTKKYYCGKKIS